jgi:hypothetical protein
MTTPTRFFAGNLFTSMQRILEALNVFVKRGGAARHRQVVREENTPRDEICGEDAVEIFHTASAS